MAIKLKSYRLRDTLKRKGKKRSGTRDLVTGAVGAIVGVAVVAQTADVLSTL